MSGHVVRPERDEAYQHLFRPVCSCGWDLPDYVRQHVAARQAERHATA